MGSSCALVQVEKWDGTATIDRRSPTQEDAIYALGDRVAAE